MSWAEELGRRLGRICPKCWFPGVELVSRCAGLLHHPGGEEDSRGLGASAQDPVVWHYPVVDGVVPSVPHTGCASIDPYGESVMCGTVTPCLCFPCHLHHFLHTLGLPY